MFVKNIYFPLGWFRKREQFKHWNRLIIKIQVVMAQIKQHQTRKHLNYNNFDQYYLQRISICQTYNVKNEKV